MGGINWLAVVISPALMFVISLVWFGPLFGGHPPFGWMRTASSDQAVPVRSAIGALLLLALPALMIGHALARIGAESLALRPWLYWMQTGGVAAFFVIPALWLSYARVGQNLRQTLVDAGYWLVAYLGMGTVFWVLA